jgi:hypothetical protein
MMKAAVLNAQYLKEHGDELIPRGPEIDVTFYGDGPIGMHIVNIPTTNSGDLVVIASSAEGAQAEGRLFFGDQIIKVNDTITKGMKMKEVKLLVADAERPIKLIIQPLCIKSTRYEDFPLCPPIPEGFNNLSPFVWGLVSRPFALQEDGPKRTVKPTKHVDYISIVPEYVFIRTTIKEDEALLEAGDLILQVGDRTGKFVLQGLLEAKYPNQTEFVVQKVKVTGTVTCPKCNGREWLFSNYCSRCGAPQKKRRQ